MADPTGYTPGYDFSDYQASNPSTPLPGDRVDIELANVATAVTSLVNSVKDVRRSDGKLANGCVTVDSLDDTVLSEVSNRATDDARASADAAALSETNAADSAAAAALSETNAADSAAAAAAAAGSIDLATIVRTTDKADSAAIAAGTADRWIDPAGLAALGLNGVAVDATAITTAENAALLVPGLYRVASTITVSGSALGFAALLLVRIGATGIEQEFRELAGFRIRRRYYNGGWSSLVAEETRVYLGTDAASGLAVQRTGLPAGINRLRISGRGISTNGTALPMLQLGTSSGYTATGYEGICGLIQNGSSSQTSAWSTSATVIPSVGAATVFNLEALVTRNGQTNDWSIEGWSGLTSSAVPAFFNGGVTLAAELDRFQLSTVGGTNAYDLGNFYYSYWM